MYLTLIENDFTQEEAFMIAHKEIQHHARNMAEENAKLNSVCMPMRYLWVFVAYVALRNHFKEIPAEYRFVKNQVVAKFFGGWCFAVTAVCCVLGMYDKDPFTFALNVITPVVLTALGIILPMIAKREKKV